MIRNTSLSIVNIKQLFFNYDTGSQTHSM